VITTYRNPWYAPGGNYGPPMFTTDVKPVKLGKYTRVQRIPGSYDFVYNGVCFAQRAGPATEVGIDADKFAQTNLERFCGVKFGPTWEDEERAVRVVIVDCQKAGLIGGSFAVLVIKDGTQCGSRSGLKTLERAQEVKAELEAVYARRAA
jgi:hypothetical protein